MVESLSGIGTPIKIREINMDGIQFVAGIGLVLLIFSILLCIGGIILLVISILKTVKGKKKIGGIVAGAIMTVTGFFAGLFIGMLFMVGGYSATFVSSDTAKGYVADIEAALEDEDSDDLYDLFAKESYSGDELTREDAREICGMLEDTDFKTIKATGSSWHNDVKEVGYKGYLTDNDTGEQMTVVMSVIIKANNRDYIGIQYLKLTKDGSEYTYGTKPKLN